MELQIIKPFSSFLYSILAFPYQLSWESASSTNFQVYFHIDNSKKQYLLWKVLTCYSLAGCYFLLLVFLVINQGPEFYKQHDFIRLVFLLMWTVGLVSLLINQAPNYFLGSEVVLLVNSTENLIVNLESKHFHNPEAFKKSKKVRSQLLAVLMVYCVLSMICTVPIFIMFRNEVWDLGSYFYRLIVHIGGPAFNTLGRIVGLMIDIWWGFLMWGSGIIVIHINFLFMHTFKYAIQNVFDLGSGRFGEVWRRKSNSEQIREILLIYRKLRVLTGIYNGIYGEIYVSPFKGMMGICIVQAVLVTVRLAKNDILVFRFGVSMLIICGALLTIFTAFMAMVNEYSLKLKDKLKGKFALNPEARRLVKSYKVEGVKSGNFYVIKKITCLTFMGMVGNMTGSALISF